MTKRRAIALVDGEHYLPVNASALETLAKETNCEMLAAVFVGGLEKIGTPEDLKGLGLPVILEKEPLKGILSAVKKFQPEVAFDLSDEPVLGYRERFAIANLLLSEGVQYQGADFLFTPPQFEDIPNVPSISVVGTGKRVGKTALGAYVGRLLSGQEEALARTFKVVIVTMGRGGPPNPELIEGNKIRMTPEYFLREANMGKHAASDHYEDALLARTVTIGCRRCGGGFAGKVFFSVVAEGSRLANTLPCDFQVYEGSGAALPPIQTDAWLLTVGAHQPLEYFEGFFGPYRLKKSDLIVITMCEEPMASPGKIEAVEKAVRTANPEAAVSKIVFRPKPLKNIRGKRVLYTVAARQEVEPILRRYLEENYGASVVATSHHLSNRPKLRQEIESAIRKENPEVLLTEVKAASIDVATRMGLEAGLEVVYCDNVPLAVDGQSLPQKVRALADLAVARFEAGKRP